MTSDGFHIECTTCTTRLKVRDASAIGDIFACPKCGSMVMVEAPEGFEPEPLADSSDSPTSAESAHAVTDAVETQPSDWTASTKATSGTGWLGIGVGTIATLTLLGTVGGYVWTNWSPAGSTNNHSNTSTDNLNATASQAPIDKPNTDLIADLPEGVGEQIPSNPTAEVETAEVGDVETGVVPPAELESVAAEQVALEQAEQEPLELEPGQLVTDDTRVEEIFDELDEAGLDETTTDQPNDSASALDGIVSDANIAPLAGLPKASRQDSAQPQKTQSENRQTSISQLANFLSGEADTDDSASTEAQSANQTADPKRVTTALANNTTEISSTPRKRDINASLDAKVFAVRFDKVSLDEFTRTVMQLSGVPIQIDPLALEQTNKRADVPISIAVIDRPIRELLESALAPLNLIPVVEKNSVRITSQRVEEQTITRTSFFVGDLLRGKSRDMDLTKLVRSLVEPASWSPEGSSNKKLGTIELRGDTLTVANTRLATIRTLILLERLRVARGLEARKKVPKHLVSMRSHWSYLDRYMSRSINLDVWRPAPWTDVVRELEDASGLRLLVDWESLADVGITPQKTTALHTRESLASDAYLHLLDAYHLALVPVDSKTLQLTTEQQMRKRHYVEFYPVDRLDGERKKQVEQLILAGSAFLDPVSNVALVAADSETHHAIVAK